MKNEMSNLNNPEFAVKKEKREDKKELRKQEDPEVSYQAQQEFYQDFGNIPVIQWERTANFDEATYIQNGQTSIAYYDDDANLVGTTTNKTFADLPSRARQYIDSKYPGYDKEGVIFFDDNEMNETDMVLYNLPFDDADNYFVQLKKDNQQIILRADLHGDVSFFKQLK